MPNITGVLSINCTYILVHSTQLAKCENQIYWSILVFQTYPFYAKSTCWAYWFYEIKFIKILRMNMVFEMCVKDFVHVIFNFRSVQYRVPVVFMHTVSLCCKWCVKLTCIYLIFYSYFREESQTVGFSWSLLVCVI